MVGAISASQPVFINNSTIAFNKAGTDGNGAGGGLHLSGKGTVEMSNSILEGNTASTSGTGNVKSENKITSLGYNLDSDGSADLSSTGDISNTSAMLLPLANGNKGLLTHGLQAASPAIDAGNSATAELRDANALLRSSNPDIGASEAGSATLTGTTGAVLVDGFKDVIWESHMNHDITRGAEPSGGNNGRSDISAQWQSTWNADYLYFYIDVLDDSDISAESPSDRPYDDDSVEIFLDPNYSRGTSYDGIDDVNLLFDRSTASVTLLSASSTAFDTSLIVSSVNNSSNGYTMEVAVPWSELGIADPTNKTIGMDVHINDDDDGNSLDTLIEWGDGHNTAYQRADVFGTGELVATPTNLAPTHLHSGLNLNADGGNNQYLQMDVGLLNDLDQLTIEATFSTLQPGKLLSLPMTGLAQPLYLSVDGSLADGQLHTLSVSWDSTSGDFKTYHDGLLTDVLNSGTTGSSLSQKGPLVIGQDYNGSAHDPANSFSGTLYDVRIWNTARSAQQISHTAGYQFDTASAPSGLHINWQMRELQGSTNNTIINAADPGAGDLTLKSIATSAQWISSLATTDLKVTEHSLHATAIGYVYPTDPQIDSNRFDFALIDDAQGRFTIDATTGLLSVADSSTIDFEENPVHELVVEVKDDTGNSYEQKFEVNLTPTNEAPALENASGATTFFILGYSPITIDPNITLNDPELSSADNYNGMT